MSFSDIFTLNNAIAPRLIRILYVVALVLISIGMIAGVARGIASMVRGQGPRITIVRPAPPPPPQIVAPAAPEIPAPAPSPTEMPATPPAAPAAAPAPAPQAAQAPAPAPRMTRREMRERGFGPRFERRGGGGNAVLVGTVRILGTLVAGVIAIMIVRILAEVAMAVLRLAEKKEA